MVTQSSDFQTLVEARQAYARQDWIVARDGFRSATEQGPLSGDDIEAMADSAWWLGFNDEALAAFEEAFRLYVSGDRCPPPRSWR